MWPKMLTASGWGGKFLEGQTACRSESLKTSKSLIRKRHVTYS
jgi:hypothetical protein